MASMSPLKDETEGQDEYNQRFKHMRRSDLFRLLKDLGHAVNPDMTIDKLRQIAQANNVDIFNFVHPDYLKYNPASTKLQEAMASRPLKAPPPKPTQFLPEQVPVRQVGSEGKEPPLAPSLGVPDIGLDDLNADGLKRLCTQRGISFKPNESAAKLRAKLRGEQDAA
jgi:hypothetical protein